MTVNQMITELQMLVTQGHGEVKVAVNMWDECVISAESVAPEFIANATVVVNTHQGTIKRDVVLIS